MIGDFLRRLTAPSQTMSDPDARLAIGALLVRIARADGTYDADEQVRIDRILGQRFGLSPFEASRLRADCESIEADAPDTVRFTRAIKDAVPLQDREAIIRAMWEIVLADGDRDHHEDALMRTIAPLLGLTDQDSNRIRLAVATS